jgi:signal peptidase I
MFFLTPRHVKHGRQFIKDAKKLLAYKRDLVSAETAEDVRREISHMEVAVASRDSAAIEQQAHRLDQVCGKLTKPVPNAAWRENVEVFLVAIVIALGVRTYFLQPFTIPTGSMQPTLNGILGFPTQEPPPNILARLAHKAVFGRTYLDVVAKTDEAVARMDEAKRPLFGLPFGLFTDTRIVTTAGNVYWANASKGTLEKDFGVVGGFVDASGRVLREGRRYQAGQPIARGYVNTGDHVFVDKFTYHFRAPKRAEVFVFNTQTVPTRENVMSMGGPLHFEWKNIGPLRLWGPADPQRGSQFYIKRLAGVPGDTLRIDSPLLFINGERARAEPFERVMSMQNGYGGYGNDPRMPLLGAPEMSFTLPEKRYFALGDNSYHSSDSRDWGGVPQNNIMGRGVLVYWPFNRHWGLIR